MSQSDHALDRLDVLLHALPVENMPMSLSELDGYVTGILACPYMIAPSEWLPHVWGETGEADFPDQETAEETIAAVMAHYNSVAEAMNRSPWIAPIYEVDPNSDETLWEPWVDGFTRAMALTPDAWDRLLDRADDETRTTLAFLIALEDGCMRTTCKRWSQASRSGSTRRSTGPDGMRRRMSVSSAIGRPRHGKAGQAVSSGVACGASTIRTGPRSCWFVRGIPSNWRTSAFFCMNSCIIDRRRIIGIAPPHRNCRLTGSKTSGWLNRSSHSK